MLVNFLKKLISFKTTLNQLNINFLALNWIKNQIKDLPIKINEFNFNGYPSLLIFTQKTKKPILFLVAHIDVVEAPAQMFQPKIKRERLYGRGAFDMKFAIACYLRLLKELKNEIKNYNFGIIVTSDEEIGGFNGVKKILEKGYRAKVCFLPDGGKNWEFPKITKAVWHIKFESYGKTTHGSRPWEGENAILNLILFLENLKKEFKKEPCKTKNHFHDTLNIGKIEGGRATNQVPDYAQAFLDIRLTKNEKREKLKKKIKDILKKFPKIKMKNLIFGKGYQISGSNPYFKLFSKIAKEKFKIKTSFCISHGSSDARFFIEKNIPTILIRPRGGGKHSSKEWIDLKDLERFYQVLKVFVQKVAKV
jgi:succinyl-diaminopimelate desuccinylase